MNAVIKERIEAIKKGKIPNRYKKVSKIGIIPEDWDVSPLKKILHNESRAVTKPNSGYWRLGLRSHAKGVFTEFVEDPSLVGMDELYEVKENDLIVNITFAWEHAIAIAGCEHEGKLVSHRFPTYVFDNDNSPGFYKYVILQKWIKKMLDEISPGGAGRNRVMSKSAFLNLPCINPPIIEQLKIAEILTTCDTLIKLKKDLLVQKEQQRKWLIQNLLNPKEGIRLNGFDGEWHRTALNDIATIANSKFDPQKDECAYKCIELEHIESKSGKIIGWVNSSQQLSIKTYFKKGDILFGKLRPYLRKITIAPFDGVCSGEIWVFKNRKEIIINDFLYYLLQTDSFISVAKTTAGTKMPRADWSLLKFYQVSFPPTLEEQQAIADILTTADHEIDLLKQELSLWETKKKALMQQLLTGIVRV